MLSRQKEKRSKKENPPAFPRTNVRSNVPELLSLYLYLTQTLLMIYRAPNTVTAPQDVLEIVEIIYDGGDESVSIAELRWDGNSCFGIRWNISMNEWDNEDKINNARVCVGMPFSNRHPVWFILPTKDPKAIKHLIQIFQN